MRSQHSPNWSYRPTADPSAELIALAGGYPLVAQLLAQRGFTTPAAAQAFLDPAYYRPAPPDALIGVDHAARLLCDAFAAGRNILVWGDFDVDGQTSTSLLVAALRDLAGPERVRFHVPNRFAESHGIRVDRLVARLEEEDFRPDLLLTCDTGIAEGPGIAYAKDQGMTVIVTDHHDLTSEYLALDPARDALWGAETDAAGVESVRRADAVINPKFQPSGDPLRTLPGVGVAFKLAQHLYTLCGRSGDETDLLDLVALGIVADVAEQVHDARYLLQLGLEKLRTTRRAGLLALMDVARVSPASINSESIGFQLGPRMNALGRLDDATVAVELLTTWDPIRAGQLAAKMERLNQQRRLLTSQITATAMEMIERNPQLLDFHALVLAHPAWHAGIVGIVASRLAEEFQRPTVLLLTPPGEPARGSARSITGVDIGGAIAACSPLLLRHGGHRGAAGLSLLPENVDRFRRELDRQVLLHRISETPEGFAIDAQATLEEMDFPLVEQLLRLAPFGQGNPRPLLHSANLTVVEDRRIGAEGAHRRLVVRGEGGVTRPVLWFDGADAPLPTGPIDLLYHIAINEYRGERSIQLEYIASRPAEVEQIAVVGLAQPALHVIDLRHSENIAAALPPSDAAAWYAEGVRLDAIKPEMSYAPRTAIVESARGKDSLVLWTIPPSPDVLQWLIASARFSTLYVCGQLACDDTFGGVTRHVAGMCKYASDRNGLVPLNRMAARLGTTEMAIRLALLWLAQRGVITLLEWPSADVVRIAPGGPRNDDEAAQIEAQLEAELAEIRAYRRYFLRAAPTELGLPVALPAVA